MDSNDELEETEIKNCICYYFDDIIKIEDFNLDDILTIEESYINILFYNISYKTLIDDKLLCIRFNKIDEFIRAFGGTRYQVLFESKKYDFIYNRIRYFIGIKSGIRYVVSHNYAKNKVGSYDLYL